MTRLRVCDAAAKVLRETNNPAVMWGDEGLLHLIAEELGWKHDGPRTSARVLAAISKTPGPFTQLRIKCHRHWVRIFRLPETDGGVNS